MAKIEKTLKRDFSLKNEVNLELLKIGIEDYLNRLEKIENEQKKN